MVVRAFDWQVKVKGKLDWYTKHGFVFVLYININSFFHIFFRLEKNQIFAEKCKSIDLRVEFHASSNNTFTKKAYF